MSSKKDEHGNTGRRHRRARSRPAALLQGVHSVGRASDFRDERGPVIPTTSCEDSGAIMPRDAGPQKPGVEMPGARPGLGDRGSAPFCPQRDQVAQASWVSPHLLVGWLFSIWYGVVL